MIEIEIGKITDAVLTAAALSNKLCCYGSEPVTCLFVPRQQNNLIPVILHRCLLAQENPTAVVAAPIPPIVSGSLDMEEFKLSNIIDLKVSQSRTFRTKNKIIRTHISDPSIAEPVIITENQFVLLGKTPGVATMLLWDDAGNSVAVDLRVNRDFSQLQSTLREIDPRIIVKTYNVPGSGDRVVLLGDVDYPESVIRAFAAANVFMDDHGFNVQVANNRLITQRVGEMGGQGGGGRWRRIRAVNWLS